MQASNHNYALDEHTRILSSITPMNYNDKMFRMSMLASLYMSQIDDTSRIPLSDARSLHEVTKYINDVMGEHTMEKELGGYIDNELSELREAQTIFCSAEIVDEIIEAQQSMLDNIILPQDVFTPCGLMVLEKPYQFATTSLVNENMWQREEWEVSSILFHSTESRNEQTGVAVRLYGFWRAVHFFEQKEKPDHTNFPQPNASFTYDTETGKTDIYLNEQSVSGREKAEINDVEKTFSSVYKDRASGTPSFLDGTFFVFGNTETEYDAEVLELKRFLLAFFRLTYEYLEVSSDKAERSFIKRAKRAGREIPTEGYLTVMNLRRKVYVDSQEAEHRGGPSYAFRVSGHWKRAYMSSRKLPTGDPGAYRHIYVKDYIKGRGVVVKSKRVVKVEK